MKMVPGGTAKPSPPGPHNPPTKRVGLLTHPQIFEVEASAHNLLVSADEYVDVGRQAEGVKARGGAGGQGSCEAVYTVTAHKQTEVDDAIASN